MCIINWSIWLFEPNFYKYMCYIATYLIFYWLYFNRWNCHRYTIICRNPETQSGMRYIQGCATNKNYCYNNVVCIQMVLHWGTNQECSINQGNIVSQMGKLARLTINTIWFLKYFIHYKNPLYSIYETLLLQSFMFTFVYSCHFHAC